MNMKELLKIVKTMPVVYGKECGEYSEEIKDILGRRGSIITLRLKVKDRYKCLWHQNGHRYLYHTVVHLKEQGTEYIIDVFHERKIIRYDVYMGDLAKLNWLGNIEIIKGGINI